MARVDSALGGWVADDDARAAEASALRRAAREQRAAISELQQVLPQRIMMDRYIDRHIYDYIYI